MWAFPYAERTRNANERPRILQAIALVERGTWRIDGLGIDPGPDVARAPSGALYPNKPPGTSAVAAVGYVLARKLSPGTGDAKMSAGIGGGGRAKMSPGTGDRPSLRVLSWWGRLLAGVLP
ncbi:MAG TPA: hypothetical protein VIK91_24340, partial [Nannocystis sp.]